MRDILTWIEFMNVMIEMGLPPSTAYIHGAFLVFLDSLGSGIQFPLLTFVIYIDTKLAL